MVIAGLPRPDLLLYLECPVDILVQRIQERGREMEAGISADYLATLDRFYKDWMRASTYAPSLRSGLVILILLNGKII